MRAVLALQSVHALIALQAKMAGRWFDSVPVRLARDGGEEGVGGGKGGGERAEKLEGGGGWEYMLGVGARRAVRQAHQGRRVRMGGWSLLVPAADAGVTMGKE